MTDCILNKCAHASMGACKTLAKSGLGECGAAYALELASRNDGYLVHERGNPTIEALRKAGKITTRAVDSRYVIARAVVPPARPYRLADRDALGLTPIARSGQNIRPTEEQFA